MRVFRRNPAWANATDVRQRKTAAVAKVLRIEVQTPGVKQRTTNRRFGKRSWDVYFGVKGGSPQRHGDAEDYCENLKARTGVDPK